MADQKEKAPEAAPAPASGGGKTIMIAVGASLISVIAALAVFYIFLMPKIAPPKSGEEEGEEEATEEVAAPAEGGGHGGEGEGAAAPKLLIQFDETTVTCIMASPDTPASILLYQVALDCANANAASLIEANKPRFAAKIRELHSYKKQTELINNPQLEQDILKGVVQESNALLQEILGKPSEKTRVKSAYHVKFFVQDL